MLLKNLSIIFNILIDLNLTVLYKNKKVLIADFSIRLETESVFN